MSDQHDTGFSMPPADRWRLLLWTGSAIALGLAANIWAIARVAM